jgi:hypothetical protein
MQREPSFHRAQRANFVFNALELSQAFALSTAHDFIWSPAPKFQASRELETLKKLPGSNKAE